MKQILSWLQNYNSRHSLLEGGAGITFYDDGTASLIYDEETIVFFDLYDENAVKDYLLNK